MISELHFPGSFLKIVFLFFIFFTHKSLSPLGGTNTGLLDHDAGKGRMFSHEEVEPDILCLNSSAPLI